MKKLMTLSLLTALLLVWSLIAFVRDSACREKVMQRKSRDIGMAVEFMDHAACAYVAREKGWFAAEGINLSAYES
ncbi:MAG: hypothetical protein JSV55_00910, partial [Deltaproteobacteria bacterium]